MLREIKHYHNSLYLTVAKVDYSSGTPSASIGYNDFSSITDNGTGDFTLNLKRPYSWTSSGNDVVVLASVLGTSGSLEYQARTYSNSAVRIAGAGSDRSHYVAILGWRDRSALNARSFRQGVYCNLNRPRMLAFQVNSSGTITSGNAGAFSCTKNSTGNYTLVYKNAFGAEPCVFITPANNTAQRLVIMSASTGASQVTWETYNTGGSLSDSGANILVIGTDSRDVSGGQDTPLTINQRKAIITGFIVDRSGASILNNSTDASYASGGTGIYTLTLTDPGTRLRRTCTALAMPTNVSSASAVRVSAAASNAFTVTSLSVGGVATSSTTHAVVVGYEDPGES